MTWLEFIRYTFSSLISDLGLPIILQLPTLIIVNVLLYAALLYLMTYLFKSEERKVGQVLITAVLLELIYRFLGFTSFFTLGLPVITWGLSIFVIKYRHWYDSYVKALLPWIVCSIGTFFLHRLLAFILSSILL
ncbi:MAG: hypothetical protein GF364_18015 [Candidatus Lokiarchaeota archaeon]|nr:hypothetical protein [Candidatus Lokiarchaeota archaeon]